jgi:nitrite reductase/ring-hydroxylating ferredoxin subunit
MEWIRVFSTEQEARQKIQTGKPQLLILDGKRICLVLNSTGFFAVQDACSHNGESLSKGHLNYLGEIICPLHNYCFSLQTGSEIQNRSRDLKTFPIKVDDAGFFVGI